jgi:hypothetical protein
MYLISIFIHHKHMVSKNERTHFKFEFNFDERFIYTSSKGLEFFFYSFFDWSKFSKRSVKMIASDRSLVVCSKETNRFIFKRNETL